LRNVFCGQREAPREQLGTGIAVAPVAGETIRRIVIRGTAVAAPEHAPELAATYRVSVPDDLLEM
ncbi:hypothetical protein B7939_12665, partial [Eggerthia catenaformis]